MLVRVVPLREKGRRLTADEVRAQPGFVGKIHMTREQSGRLGRWERIAYVTTKQPSLFLELHAVELTRWTHRGIVLTGIERHYRERKQPTLEYRQSWWIQILDGGGAGGAGGGSADPVEPVDKAPERKRAAAARVLDALVYVRSPEVG